MKQLTDQLNEASSRYLSESDPAHRKKLGQYFTPKDVREHLLSQLPTMPDVRILDPACGSGEFLLSAREHFQQCDLVGWEIDPQLAALSRRAVPMARIVQIDSLTTQEPASYDFVIGNPPYFEFKPDDALRRRYQSVIKGRSNIFSMFVKLGLDLLKPGGYLAYVIPPSMNNGAYFANLRQYIIENANIEYLTILPSSSLFHSAQQSVMIMVLKKGRNAGDYVFTKNGITIFSPDVERLRRAFDGRTTLRELGFTVRTGKVVWNQNRDKLTADSRGAVPLIWAHNIIDGEVALRGPKDKPQFVKTGRYDTGPAIVVNRVTGAVTRVQLKSAVIEAGFRFVGENHVNVIYPPDGIKPAMLRNIAKQICDPGTIETMKLVTGNTQVSRTELECLLPLKI